MPQSNANDPFSGLAGKSKNDNNALPFESVLGASVASQAQAAGDKSINRFSVNLDQSHDNPNIVIEEVKLNAPEQIGESGRSFSGGKSE